MPDTKTPVSERSKDELVLAIAEMMGWTPVRTAYGAFWMGEPHKSSTTAFDPMRDAADRERVMLAMPDCSVRYFTTEDGRKACQIAETYAGVVGNTYTAYAATHELAFCEAVNMRIEAQG